MPMTQPMMIRVATPAEWDSLVDQAPLGTVYHREAWLGAIEQSEGIDISRVVCERGGVPICVWPIGVLRKGPLRVAGSPLPGWNTAYMGPVFTTHAETSHTDRVRVVQAMIRSRPIRSPSFLALRANHTDLDLTPIGFRETRAFETYEMDLTRGEEALWAGLKSTCRTRIRKGEKNGLVVREETDSSYLDDFWRMATDVFAKSNQRPPYTRALLEQIESRLRHAGELLVTSAFQNDERVATLIIPHNKRTAMYFAGGTHADALQLAPNNLLHWETMKRCMRRGLEAYDFISNRGNPGRFKKTFGPEERISCRHWERAGNRFIQALRNQYEQRARARRRSVSTPQVERA